MAQVKGNVSSEHLWGVICDELHDEHPAERVRWLREHLEPTTVGMVWRAAPRLRPLIEGQWPQWNVSPKGLRHVPPAQMVRMLLVEDFGDRQRAGQRLPKGFAANHADHRHWRHSTLGNVVIAVRYSTSQQGAPDNWQQWHALYQERWGIEAADYELARHSHENGVRFGEGGLAGLLEDLEIEAWRIRHEQERREEQARRLTADIDAYERRIAEIGGLVPEDLRRTSQDHRPRWALPLRSVLGDRVQAPQQGWTHRGVDMGIALDAILGSPVEFVRNAATMSTTVRWLREGVQVEVGDQETVMSPGPEALARNIVQRLLEARRAMPNPPSSWTPRVG